jgi:DNA polymerase III sliding clamp (beta) subunit (PCNA family)
MKLTLTQPDLNQALRSVSRAVGTGRNSHPVLAHVLLDHRQRQPAGICL